MNLFLSDPDFSCSRGISSIEFQSLSNLNEGWTVYGLCLIENLFGNLIG